MKKKKKVVTGIPRYSLGHVTQTEKNEEAFFDCFEHNYCIAA